MFALVPICLAISSSVVLSSAVVAGPRSLPLLTRQTLPSVNLSSIPTQCQTACVSITNNTCTDISCICTAQTISGIAGCLDCATAAVHNADATSLAQSSINSLTDACNSAGMPVPAQKIASAAASGVPLAQTGALLAVAGVMLGATML